MGMDRITFEAEQTCPKCGGRFSIADKVPKYNPVSVFLCPRCQSTLWQPGCEAGGPIFVFDPEADAGGI